jgi:hypothetical protein
MSKTTTTKNKKKIQKRSLSLLKCSTEEVVHKMLQNGQRRAFFVYNKEKNEIMTSHPMFDEVAEALKTHHDYENHEVR